MIVNEPALLELFYSLQESGFPLGMESYYALLKSLDAGFGKRDHNCLAQLCCTLWVKSEEEEAIFRKRFNQLIPKSNYTEILSGATKKVDRELKKSELSPDEILNQYSYSILKYSKKLSILFIFILILLGGLFFFRSKSKPGKIAFHHPWWTDGFSVKENENEAKIFVTHTAKNREETHGLIKIDESHYLEPAALEKDFIFTPISISFDSNFVNPTEYRIKIIDDHDYEPDEEIILHLIIIQDGKEVRKDTAKLIIKNDDPIFPFPKSWKIFVYISCIAIISVLILIIYQKVKKINGSDSDKNDQPNTTLSVSKLSSEVVKNMFDGIQVAKAFKQPANQTNENYLIDTSTLPVTYRQIKQSLRYLRNFVREGVPTDLDLDQTIEQIGKNGFLLNPVLQPRPVNKTEFLLLIDQDGSMVPFHHVSQALVNAASRGGRFKQIKVYYFHNCPGDYLYNDPYRLKPNFIEDCLVEFANRRIVCLIFSDAGAARGQFTSKRRRETKFFLKELKQSVNRIAWINPVPRERWENTTAEDIAELIPMYEFSRKEIYLAIETLRGRGKKTMPSINI